MPDARPTLQIPLPLCWRKSAFHAAFPDLKKAPVEAEAGEVAALAHYYQDNEERRDWLILTARLPHNATAWNLLINLAYEEHSLFHPLVRVDLQNKLDALYILEIL